MNGVVKAYIKMHAKYWYCYIAAAVIFVPATIVSLMLSIGVNAYFGDAVASNSYLVMLGFFTSIPLIIPNYKAAELIGKVGRKPIMTYFLISQTIIFIVMVSIMFVIGATLTKTLFGSN